MTINQNSNIFQTIKDLVELDLSEDIFDNQLLNYINQNIQYMINNGIPITLIDMDTNFSDWSQLRAGDENIICKYLSYTCLVQLDNSFLSKNTIDKILEDTLYQLKVIYDSV